MRQGRQHAKAHGKAAHRRLQGGPAQRSAAGSAGLASLPIQPLTQSSPFFASASASICWGPGRGWLAVSEGCCSMGALQHPRLRAGLPGPSRMRARIVQPAHPPTPPTCAVSASQRGVTRAHCSHRIIVGEHPVLGMSVSGPALSGYSLRITPWAGGVAGAPWRAFESSKQWGGGATSVARALAPLPWPRPPAAAPTWMVG